MELYFEDISGSTEDADFMGGMNRNDRVLQHHSPPERERCVIDYPKKRHRITSLRKRCDTVRGEVIKTSYTFKGANILHIGEHSAITTVIDEKCPERQLVAKFVSNEGQNPLKYTYTNMFLNNYRECSIPFVSCLINYIIDWSFNYDIPFQFNRCSVFILIFPRFDFDLKMFSTKNPGVIFQHPARFLSIIYQVLLGLKGIHEKGLAHQNLTLENILIKVRNDNYYYARISDMKSLCGGPKGARLRCYQEVESMVYYPPEWKSIWVDERSYNVEIDTKEAQKGDMWALGMCILLLLNGGQYGLELSEPDGEHLENVDNDMDVLNNKIKELGEIVLQLDDHSLTVMFMSMTGLLNRNPNLRPSSASLVAELNQFVEQPKIFPQGYGLNLCDGSTELDKMEGLVNNLNEIISEGATTAFIHDIVSLIANYYENNQQENASETMTRRISLYFEGLGSTHKGIFQIHVDELKFMVDEITGHDPDLNKKVMETSLLLYSMF